MGIRNNKHGTRIRTMAAVISMPLVLIFVAGPLLPESAAGGGGRRSGITEDCNEGSCNVSMTGGTFTPETLRIRPGTVVTWSNEDKMPHTVTGTESTVDTRFAFNSGILNPTSSGKQWQLEFSKKGTFGYVCQLHRGMAGQIVVAGEPSEDSPGINFLLLVAAGVFGTLGLVATVRYKARHD